jgi:hypothetical protein
MRYEEMIPKHSKFATAQNFQPVRGLVILLLFGFVLVGCSRRDDGGSATSQQPTSLPITKTQTQINDGGGVTIKVTWQGEAAGPVFDVVLDTSSLDLDSYDLREQAVLRINNALVVHPIGWDAPKGGNHRAGTLTFPATTPDGKEVIGPKTRIITLTILDVGSIPQRGFQWTR